MNDTSSAKTELNSGIEADAVAQPAAAAPEREWSEQQILDQFRAVLKEKLELDEAGVDEDTALTALGADSLMVIELMMELEERFGVEIKDADAKLFSRVGDVIRHVRARVAA